MPDLSTSGSSQRPGLSNGIGREVVEVHIALLGVAFQPVDRLRVFAGTQGHGGQDLGLTSREQAGAMHPWEQPYFSCNLPDLIQFAAIRPDFVFDNQSPDLLL